MKVGLDILVVLLLVLIEAVFVATEISLVSLRALAAAPLREY